MWSIRASYTQLKHKDDEIIDSFLYLVYADFFDLRDILLLYEVNILQF